jgi:O-antigen ligase
MNSSAIYSQVETRIQQNPIVVQWITNLLITVVLVLLPYERKSFDYNTKIVDFALVVTILFSVICILFISKIVHLPLIGPIWIILIASIVATMTGIPHSDSFVAVVKDVYIYVWFLALTNLLISQSYSNLNALLKIWSLVAVVISATSMLGMLGLGPVMFHTSPNYTAALSIGKLNRAVGTYVNPNALAAYVSVSFFVVLATNWPRLVRFLLGLFIFGGIIGTGSIGATTTTVGSLFILFGLNELIKTKRIPKFWSNTISIGLVIIVVGLMLFLILPSELTPSGSFLSSDFLSITIGRLPRSFSSRTALIRNGWPIYSKYPLGTGPETFSFLTGELHNDYIAYLFERGPLGLVGWLGIVGTILFRSVQVAYNQIDDQRRWQMLAFGMGFLGCAVNSFSHEISHFRQIWVYIAFLFGVCYQLAASEKPRGQLLRGDSYYNESN